MAMAEETEKGTHWNEEKTRLLIEIWSDQHIQAQLRGATRNLVVFEKISNEMKERHNIARTAIQCREKIKKLRQAFSKAEDANRKSGNKRHTCPFYNLLAPILRDRPIMNPPTLLSSQSLDTSNTQDSFEDDLSQDDDLEGDPARLAMGTATVQGDNTIQQPSTSGETQNDTQQPGTSTTPDQGPPRPIRKRLAPKRKASALGTDNILESFKEMQENTLKAFNAAEKERVAEQMALEERREKREDRREKRMFTFFAQMFGANANNVPHNDDSDTDSDDSTIVPISHVLGSASRVLYK